MRYRQVRFPGFKCKALTFSFDDGISDDIRLVEMLNKYDMKCTFNISSQRAVEDTSPMPRELSQKEVLALYYPSGHDVACHGCRHISPYQSSSPVMIREMLEDRVAMEKLFGRQIFGFVYPDDGRNRPDMTEAVRSLGFHYCRCGAYDDSFRLPYDWLQLSPTAKFNMPDLPQKMERFLSLHPEQNYISQRQSIWMYIWGHSHELRSQDNWHIIDDIGQTLGGRDDIWYANNGDICEYIRAYRSLLTSADDSIIYNPTLYTIYMEVDKENVKIEPGQTLYF